MRGAGRGSTGGAAVDGRTFAALVQRYDPRLRELAYRLLGSRERMDDVLQEAYVRAFRALPRFRGEAALETWLYRIVYNACLDELRRGSRARARETSVADPELPGLGDDPGETVPEHAAIAAALAALPPTERAAVLLVDGRGLAYDEAAEVLGVPRGTVASRLNRARASLRAALRPEVRP